VVGVFTGVSVGSASAGPWSGLAAGGLGGAVGALLLGAVDVLGARDARPGEPHGPRQSATVPVRNGLDLPQRTTAALQEPGAPERA
jgi:hypothetical protein